MKIIYSPNYFLSFGETHVFPVQKYQLAHKSIQEFTQPEDFIEPSAATDGAIHLVHDFQYIEKLKAGTLSNAAILRSEVPLSPQLVNAFWWATGGTILAGQLAKEEGRALNLSGGFHHAFPDHGEGFCLVNDVAVAIRLLQQLRTIKTAMTIDCDVHHGNGTAFIFSQDPSVYTISLHQLNNYPTWKPPSDIDVNLNDGCSDEEYIRELEQALETGFSATEPDLIFYLAGADPYREDLLGGLGLTIEGLAQRDRVVLEFCKDRNVPCAIVLAGGYARKTLDTVLIHVNTARIALEIPLL